MPAPAISVSSAWAWLLSSRPNAAATPPWAQAEETPVPSGLGDRTVTGRGASLSAVKSPARPAPTTSAPSASRVLSKLFMLVRPIPLASAVVPRKVLSLREWRSQGGRDRDGRAGGRAAARFCCRPLHRCLYQPAGPGPAELWLSMRSHGGSVRTAEAASASRSRRRGHKTPGPERAAVDCQLSAPAELVASPLYSGTDYHRGQLSDPRAASRAARPSGPDCVAGQPACTRRPGAAACTRIPDASPSLRARSLVTPPAHFDHALDGQAGRRDDLGRHCDFLGHGMQAPQHVFEVDALHVRADVAAAQKVDPGGFAGDIVRHRALGDHDHAGGLFGLYPIDHGRRGAGEVDRVDHLGRAFKMGDDPGGGVGVAQLGNVFGGEGLVHFTGAGPGDDLLAGSLGGILRQIL